MFKKYRNNIKYTAIECMRKIVILYIYYYLLQI